MITNTKNQLPIKHFLQNLRAQSSFCPHYMMIDCSDVEASAIGQRLSWKRQHHLLQLAFPQGRLSSKQTEDQSSDQSAEGKRSSLTQAQLSREGAVQGIKQLMKSDSETTFNLRWEAYQVRWQSEPAWLAYINAQWKDKKTRWAEPWRADHHDSINTNNYIERWHEELKHRHLKTL